MYSIYLLFGVYFLVMLGIFLYSIGVLDVLLSYFLKPTNADRKTWTDWPTVTIQLPVFNEKYVVEDLIDAIAQLDYPWEKLEVQLLDDSTDESFAIGTKKVAHWQAKGFPIEQIQRDQRTGFKAGALAYGLEHSKGEFVAIFDADFDPHPSFLKEALSYFTNPEIGVVQTRWGHKNRRDSFLTRMQALGLDMHFSVEQGGRNKGKHLINFNGTAGVWRRNCVLDAGSWSSDTLTEDLDLSYRVQLKGWKFRYIEHIEAPAELPVSIEALKSQQHRWTKGAAECSLKNSRQLWSSTLSLRTKLHGTLHLFNSSIYILILAAAFLSIPIMTVMLYHPELREFVHWGMVFLFSFAVFFIAYSIPYFKFYPRELWRYPIDFLAFLSVSMGLSIHNGRAVIEAWRGKKSAFIRTPKLKLTHSALWQGNAYLKYKQHGLVFVELLFGLLFTAGVVVGIWCEFYGFVLLHSMLAFGFLFVTFTTLNHRVAVH